MYKVITPNQIGDEPSVRVIGSDMEKFASLLPKEISDYIKSLVPDPGKVYALINAMGASEYYGSNKNGDSFYEDALMHEGDYGYKTFERNARIFRHHRNKDPMRAYGKVLKSVYDKPMHRVLLIISVDRDKAPDIARDMDEGKNLPVSMGCFVAGNSVTMGDGNRKPIEEVCVGDLVMTHKGRARRVTEVHFRTYSGSFYDIKTEDHETITCTEEHPFYTVRDEQVKTPDQSGGWKENPTITPDWTHASCMEGHHVLEPVIPETGTPGRHVEIKQVQGKRLFVDGYLVTPIVEIASYTSEQTVYNLEVEEDRSYLVEGLAVHNCRVPADFCSVCGNASKTRAEYCNHLKYQMNKILDDGRIVCAINKEPKFFDLSFVLIGADKTAFSLKKVASQVDNVVSSAYLGEQEYGMDNRPEKKASPKRASITKDIQATMKHSPELIDTGSYIRLKEPDIPNEILDKAASLDMERSLATFGAVGIKLKPHEFQRMALTKIGKQDLANYLQRARVSIPDICPACNDVYCKHAESVEIDPCAEIHEEFIEVLKPVIEKRSMLEPHMTLRASEILGNDPLRKKPNEEIVKQKIQQATLGEDILGMLASLGLGFFAYQNKFPEQAAQVKLLIRQKPYLAPLIFGGMVGLNELIKSNPRALQDPLPGDDISIGTVKTSGATGDLLALTAPTGLAYTISSSARRKEMEGRRLSPIEKLIRDYPLPLAALGTIGLMKSRGSLSKLLKVGSASGNDSYLRTALEDVITGIYRASPAGIIGSVTDQALMNRLVKLFT